MRALEKNVLQSAHPLKKELLLCILELSESVCDREGPLYLFVYNSYSVVGEHIIMIIHSQ